MTLRIRNIKELEAAMAADQSLVGADMRGANMLGANMLGADMREAFLVNAVMRGANMRGANMSGACLYQADMFGANMRYANMRDADMGGANMRGVDMRGASMRGANMRNTNFAGANMRGVDMRGASMRGAILPEGIPTIKYIHQKIYAAASQPGALNMKNWHACETTHCRAGWVIVLAGEAGKSLEKELGTPVAAALIYYASDPALEKVPDFYEGKAAALADMRRLAEMEAAATVGAG